LVQCLDDEKTVLNVAFKPLVATKRQLKEIYNKLILKQFLYFSKNKYKFECNF